MRQEVLNRYKDSNECDRCGLGSVATAQLDGSDFCLKCLFAKLTEDYYIIAASETDCAECGSTLVGPDPVLCLSCGNHDECHSNDDCDSGSCSNCGYSSPERCEKCLLCSSCDKPIDEEIENGKAALMHEACFEEVKRDAGTLLAAEPTEEYEVTW